MAPSANNAIPQTFIEIEVDGQKVTIQQSILNIVVTYNGNSYKVFFQRDNKTSGVNVTSISPNTDNNHEFIQRALSVYWKKIEDDWSASRPRDMTFEEAAASPDLKYYYYEINGKTYGIHCFRSFREDSELIVSIDDGTDIKKYCVGAGDYRAGKPVERWSKHVIHLRAIVDAYPSDPSILDDVKEAFTRYIKKGEDSLKNKHHTESRYTIEFH